MANINMKAWRQKLLSERKRAAMPIMTHPGIERIGKTVLEAVTNGEVHFRAIEAVNEVYPVLAATMIMDLTVEAEAFGCPVSFSENEVPAIANKLVSDIASVQQLAVPDLQAGRIPEYLKAARLAAGQMTRPVFGGCIGPFSLAGRLFDLTDIMTAAFLEPETITLLLEKCTRFLALYLEGLKNTGINGIIMAEPAAGLLDEAMCQHLSSVYVKQLVEAFQDDHFLFILHNCGNTGQVTQAMVETGALGIHVGNRADMKTILKEVPSDVLVSGNLDPVGAFKMADPAGMKHLTSALLHETAMFPNFVLSSGCDTPPGVKEDNILAFFEALDEFNHQR